MTEPLSPKKRRKYFVRTAPQTVRLTPRDIEIFRLLYKHRLVNSDQFCFVLSGSDANIKRRLSALYHAGFIDRPPAQLERYIRSGSKPLVYALGNKGADALAQHDGIKRGRIDWTAKNREVARLFVTHTLMTTELNLRIKFSAEKHGLRFLDADHIVSQAPEATRTSANPWRWRVELSDLPEPLGVIPDTAFALVDEKTDKLAWFVVEIDAGTMPIDRKNLRISSIRRKLIAYEAIRQVEKVNPEQARFPFAPFRVLFITTSKERAQNMVSCVKSLKDNKGTNFFIFSDFESATSGDAIAHKFLTGTGGTTKLLS